MMMAVRMFWIRRRRRKGRYGDHVFTVFTRCRPPVPFLARTTLSLLEMYMYLGRSTSKKPAIFLQGVPKKCLIELLRKRV